MSEYFTIGWWVIYTAWAVVVGCIWLDASQTDQWSLGQWVMFITIVGPIAWVIAAISGVVIGLGLLWELLGGVGKMK